MSNDEKKDTAKPTNSQERIEAMKILDEKIKDGNKYIEQIENMIKEVEAVKQMIIAAKAPSTDFVEASHALGNMQRTLSISIGWAENAITKLKEKILQEQEVIKRLHLNLEKLKSQSFAAKK